MVISTFFPAQIVRRSWVLCLYASKTDDLRKNLII